MNYTSLNLNHNVEKICFLNFYFSPVNLLRIQEFNLGLTIEQEVKLVNEMFNKFNGYQNSKQYIAQLTEKNIVDFLNRNDSSDHKIKKLNLDQIKFRFLKILITHPLWINLKGEIDFLNLNLESNNLTISIAKKLDYCFESILNTNDLNLDAESLVNIFYHS